MCHTSELIVLASQPTNFNLMNSFSRSSRVEKRLEKKVESLAKEPEISLRNKTEQKSVNIGLDPLHQED